MHDTASNSPVFGPEDLLIVPGEATAETPPAPEAPAAPDAPAPDPAPATPPPPPPPPPPDPRITEMDRTAFMRHMLGSARFVKDYTLKGGALRVKLQSRTVAENDAIYDLMVADAVAGKVGGNATSLDYVMRLYRYYLSASLVSFVVDGTIHKPVGATIQERHAWISSMFSETQFRVLLRCQEEFEYLQGALFKEALSEDFTGDRVGVS